MAFSPCSELAEVMKARSSLMLLSALVLIGCASNRGGVSDDYDYGTGYANRPGGPHFQGTPQRAGMDPTDIRDPQWATRPGSPANLSVTPP